MFQISVLAIPILANLLLGMFVYLKNPRSATSRNFLQLTVAFVVWSAINYMSVHPAFLGQLAWIRLTLLAGAMLNYAVFTAFLAFPENKMPDRYFRRLHWAQISTLFVMVLTQTPLVFQSLKVTSTGSSPVPAPGIALFLLQTVILLVSCILMVVNKFRTSHGVVREQLRLVLFGVGGTFSLIIITNLLLVVAFKITALVPLGPAFTLIFSGSFAYAIIRHKLFDIRAAVARSVGYLMIVVTITAIYGIGLFGAIDIIFRGPQNQVWRQVASVILITPLALIFHRTKLFFDRVTNRLFYRDAYDTQDVLDQIGRVVVSEIDLYRMLRSTRAILTEALKVTFVEYALIKNDTVYFEARTTKNVEPPALFDLGQVIREQKKPIVIIADPRGTTRLHQKFVEANVAISLRLKTQEQVVGYILLGEKRSGDIFSAQDKKLLEIMASQLAISMQNALRFEEIQNFNLTLQARVSEATHKLRSANEKLKVLDETKDDFISMASHQLRTPLTSIKGYISMVLEGDAGKLNAQQEQMLGQAFFSSQRMVYLIADLLNLSRLKTGKFIIEQAPVNLADVVEQELQQLKEAAANRGHTLEFVKPDTFPTLMLDETKMRQVIMNFTDNAIYYTPNGGHIVVRLVDNPLTVELRVEDNGIGVPKQQQPHLFTKFFRADNARKARPDGTGLGLFMAKKVIVASGGSLIFTTEEGKGSTFGFSFVKSRFAMLDVAPTASAATPE